MNLGRDFGMEEWRGRHAELGRRGLRVGQRMFRSRLALNGEQ